LFKLNVSESGAPFSDAVPPSNFPPTLLTLFTRDFEITITTDYINIGNAKNKETEWYCQYAEEALFYRM